MTGGKTGDRARQQQRKVIRAWCMYDWANSAYATSGGAAIFPIYFVFLFRESLGESAVFLGLTFTGSSVWSLAIAGSTAVVALSSPILGVIADRTTIKKALLWIYTGVGALFTVLLFFSAYTSQPWLWFMAMFMLANIGFAGCLVFYNAFLPHLAPRELMDDVSSRGFAFGYVGGGVLLALHLAMIAAAQHTDYADLATRIAIASIGVWWFGWALWTLLVVPEPPIPNPVRGLRPGRAVALAGRELGRTFREIRSYRALLVYLAAYLLFNDGIQTVLTVAGAFAADTIGIPLVFNMATVLIIQFVAAGGALAFSWLAGRTTTKSALALTLAGWSLVILFGAAIAPLSQRQHEDFDYQLNYRAASGQYQIAAVPEAAASRLNREWQEELAAAGLTAAAAAPLARGDTLTAARAAALLAHVGGSDRSLYGLSLAGGPLDGQRAVGRLHPSSLGDGPLDWWPASIRRLVWEPLGLAAGYQWLTLGLLVGLVMGGSQALARSLFAQITPHTRSGEFFSFFGFMGRVSSVFGPILYILITGVGDTRLGVVSIMALVIAGGILLRWVDVAAATRAAEAEDARHYAEAAKTPPEQPGMAAG